MNRLVIIGNGFDLAHGLSTAYKHFIDWYWQDVFKKFVDQDQFQKYHQDNLLDFKITFSATSPVRVIEEFQEIITYRDYKNYRELIFKDFPQSSGFKSHLKFKNIFFEKITDEYSAKNWVDIESQYYDLLKGCLEDKDNSKVLRLHREFDEVKTLLEKYLSESVCAKIDFNMPNKDINLLINHFDIWNRYTSASRFLDEFNHEDKNELQQYQELLRQFNTQGSNDITQYVSDTGRMAVKNLFLNFNYTRCFDVYLDRLNNSDKHYFGESKLIQIHGRLNDNANQINFGFGDEMDESYKLLERKNDNEYLTNIKSFKYFQNSNYKGLLDFIESGKFQVYIMGHSCGLSDRILLNRIFEHHYCRSIKVFYHEFETPSPDGRTDNYTEIVQNISRHFNKKEMMREKIVNKSLCHPLPQSIRFENRGSYFSWIVKHTIYN